MNKIVSGRREIDGKYIALVEEYRGLGLLFLRAGIGAPFVYYNFLGDSIDLFEVIYL